MPFLDFFYKVIEIFATDMVADSMLLDVFKDCFSAHELPCVVIILYV